LSGDFSATAGVVRDPVTGTPFPGNQIPDSRIDLVAKKFAPFFPKANPALGATINFINNHICPK